MEEPQATILLVQYKKFFIPANAASYEALTKLGMPITRIHADHIPMIKSAAAAKGYELRGKHWSQVVEKASAKLEAFWRSVHKNCDVEFRAKQWIFSTKKADAYDAARKALPKLERSLREFFDRWGFVGEFVPSESRERLKLVVSFQMDSKRMPSIAIRKDLQDIEPSVLTFGFNRLTMRRDRHFLHWAFEQKSGDNWVERFSSSCTADELTNPLAFVGALIDAQKR